MVSNFEARTRMLDSAFHGLQLLQSGHIRWATEIWGVEQAAVEQFQKLYYLGYLACEANPQLTVVASTQFSEYQMRLAGADYRFSRTFYVSHWENDLTSGLVKSDMSSSRVSLRGSLLISPKIRDLRDEDNMLLLETCGSIGRGKLAMCVVEPARVEFSAWIYNPCLNPDAVVYKEGVVTGKHAGLLRHQIDHLDGLDVTNQQPRRLIDPFIIGNLRQANTPSLTFAQNSVVEIQPQEGMNWLVFRDGRLQIIDPNGRFVENYQRS